MGAADHIPKLQLKSIASAKWNVAGQAAVQLLNVGGTIVLSRWLPPASVGLLLMLSLISNFVAIIMNHAIGSAIVQHHALDRTDLSSIFWLNVFIAAGFHFLLLISSPLISGFYREDAILVYLPYFGLIFFFYALGGVSQALLVKRHNFKKIVSGNIAGIVLSFLTAVIMLWKGYGVESLFVQLLLNTFISSLYFFIAAKWKPAFKFSTASISKVQRFAGHLSFNSALEYLAFNFDNFLVGRYFGNAGLGLYGRARQWVFLPVQNIAFAISRSFFPTFAQLKDNRPAAGEMYLFSFRLTFYLTTIALTYMVVAAEDLVFLFLGEPWLEIVPLFVWFSLTGVVGTINGFNDSFITSQGRTEIIVRNGIFEKVFTITAILLALPYGLKGLVIARLIAAGIILFPKVYAVLTVSALDFRRWVASIFTTLLISSCLLVSGFLLMRILSGLSASSRLFIVSGVYLILAIILSGLFREKAFLSVRDAILQRKSPLVAGQNEV